MVDCAVYERGVRRPGPLELDDAFEAARAAPGNFSWIGLAEPTVEEFDRVAAEFGLHPLAVEDAVEAHQRPKLEVYGDIVFVVLKTVYRAPDGHLRIGELMALAGPDFIITVRHGEGAGLADVRHQVEQQADLLRLGPATVLHAVVDHVVDAYEDLLRPLDDQIEEIEVAVFRPGGLGHAERIYRLKRDVLRMRRAVSPLCGPLGALVTRRVVGWIPPELDDYFRDVHDHVLRAAEHLDQLDGQLTTIHGAQLTQISVRQNDDMRKISAWVAIAAVPTMIAGIYGMNFQHMPELTWYYGYFVVLGVMASACLALYLLFRRSGWL